MTGINTVIIMHVLLDVRPSRLLTRGVASVRVTLVWSAADTLRYLFLGTFTDNLDGEV